VQRLCNGFRLALMFLELFHREVQTPALDVQVSAGRGQVGVAQHLPHIVD
jgi:hypothetical protein